MTSNALELDETENDWLLFDISDEALERAANVDGTRITTWAYCTQVWYNCGWPM
jgi:hypothetical protein